MVGWAVEAAHARVQWLLDPHRIGFTAVSVLANASILAIGAFVVLRSRGNRVGWILLTEGIILCLLDSMASYLGYGYGWSRLQPPHALPLLAQVRRLDVICFNVAWFLAPYLFLLFPDGRLPGPRWRLLAGLADLPLLLTMVLIAVTPDAPYFTEAGPTPPAALTAHYGAHTLLGWWAAHYWRFFQAGLLLSAVSLVLRYRRSDTVGRQQIKWFVSAASVFATWTLLLDFLPQQHPLLLAAVLPILIVFLVSATALAVLKYRLYDIDLILSKLFVYGSLAAFITAVYVGVVSVIGNAIGTHGRPNVALSIAATSAVALVFSPLRERLQLVADRLVYGPRATPYEAVAQLARRLGDALSLEDVLPRMAEAAGSGIVGSAARVRVFGADGTGYTAAWPPEAADSDWSLAHVVPIVDQQVEIGEIASLKGAGLALTVQEHDLLTALASQSGLALRNVRLALQLQDRLQEISWQADELMASRRRIVVAQDHERRRLERDIHDGAQQQLVAIGARLTAARELLVHDPERAAPLLDAIALMIPETLESLRDLARGVFPQLLADKGLAAAIRAHVNKYFPGARVVASAELDGRRLDPRVEAAMYFCCLEGLQNAAKHAPHASVTVELTISQDTVRLRVEDDGPGFDSQDVGAGMGVQNLVDRMAAIGGRLQVVSQDGCGTRMTGEAPVTPPDLADRGDVPVANRGALG
jgi:signal transduction histidine kinase